MAKVYIGDKGTIIELNMQEDLTAFTVLKLFVRKLKADRSGSETLEWVAIQKAGVGNENILQYTASVVTSPFDVSGTYVLQPYGETAGWKGYGESYNLVVYNRFE